MQTFRLFVNNSGDVFKMFAYYVFYTMVAG